MVVLHHDPSGSVQPYRRFKSSPPPGFSLEPGKGWKMLKGLYGAHQSGSVWAKTWREWMKQHYPEFHEAGTERCVYVMREAADGTPLDLSLARDIQLEPGERLVIRRRPALATLGSRPALAIT